MPRARFAPLLAAALLLGGCGAAASSTTPAPAPGATEAPSSTTTGAATEPASQPPSADPGLATTPSGVTYEDLVGTWVGDIVDTVGERYTWASSLTLVACTEGESCGDLQMVAQDGTTDEEVGCHYTVADPTYQDDFGAITLVESVVAADSDDYCYPTLTLAVSLMPSGATLAVEERADRQWVTYGLLRR